MRHPNFVLARQNTGRRPSIRAVATAEHRELLPCVDRWVGSVSRGDGRFRQPMRVGEGDPESASHGLFGGDLLVTSTQVLHERTTGSRWPPPHDAGHPEPPDPIPRPTKTRPAHLVEIGRTPGEFVVHRDHAHPDRPPPPRQQRRRGGSGLTLSGRPGDPESAHHAVEGRVRRQGLNPHRGLVLPPRPVPELGGQPVGVVGRPLGSKCGGLFHPGICELLA
jgi:hypothetical protein